MCLQGGNLKLNSHPDGKLDFFFVYLFLSRYI